MNTRGMFGGRYAVEIVFQAIPCNPLENWCARSAWHWAQVSISATLALSASVAELWSVPWQVLQVIPESACLESFQSVTTPGVTLLWQSTQASLPCAVAKATHGKPIAASMPTANRKPNVA
jgi:hypothetical protein